MDTVGSVKRQGTQRVGFLLMDQFTLVSLSSAIDPLRVANSLSDVELYRWCLIGAGEEEQVSSDGVRVKLDHNLTDEIELDLVIVVGGIDIEQSVTKVDLSWLRKHSGPRWALCVPVLMRWRARACLMAMNAVRTGIV